MSTTVADQAARLVALLGEINDLYAQALASAVRGGRVSWVGDPRRRGLQPVSKDVYEKRQQRKAEFDAKLQALRDELSILVRSLAPTAVRSGVSWEPLVRFSTRWRATAGIGEAITLATLLEAIVHTDTAGPDQSALSDSEQTIIEAIGADTLRGERVAKNAGYPFNSTFKATLASLTRQGILGNEGKGYFVRTKVRTDRPPTAN